MDAWNYIAFGGLERIFIIGAATLIGYWGYRIFASSRGAGLALITVAALVLVGALLTSGQHLERVNDTLVASNTPAAPTPPETTLPAAVPASVAQPAPDLQPTAQAPLAAEAPATGTTVDAAAPEETAAEQNAAAATQSELETSVADAAADDQRVQRIVPLASGQELGGRITSVRSENVTLEWSPEVSRRRVISSSREP